MGSKSYSKGISWIDDCRIPFVDEKDKNNSVPGGKVSYTSESWGQQAGLEKDLQPKRNPNTTGRFPANLLVSDDMLNDGVISKSQKGVRIIEGHENVINPGGWKEVNRTSGKISGFDDKGTNSRYYDIDKWFDKIIE
jgi:hypothetical protein